MTTKWTTALVLGAALAIAAPGGADAARRPPSCKADAQQCRKPTECCGGACVRVGKKSQCCTPATCAGLGADCGTLADGCGGTLDCGSCPTGETCGGGGMPNVCGCTPTSCAAEGAECGTIADGCGGTLDCGGCEEPATCGGGGLPNRCGASLCAHDPCVEGVKLDPACDSCVAAICAVDSFCCTTLWDDICVDRVEMCDPCGCFGCF